MKKLKINFKNFLFNIMGKSVHYNKRKQKIHKSKSFDTRLTKSMFPSEKLRD